jgi:GTP-binding protein
MFSLIGLSYFCRAIEYLDIQYTGSFPRNEDCPKPKYPEFALIGRSNVGKSSLINYLAGRKQIAHTSSRPGKTQSLNFYWVEQSWYIVDLPGYGYAKVSKTERKRWEQMIRNYLVLRPSLHTVLQLIDVSVPPQQSDLEFSNWLGEMQVPFIIIYTKADKIAKTKRQGMIKAFEEKMLESWEQMPPAFVSSANKRFGGDEILTYLRELVAETPPLKT